MIRYTLKCDNDHVFDSWFPSADGFDTLRAKGLASCPECGSAQVDKTLMAPRVRPSRKTTVDAPEPARVSDATETPVSLSAPDSALAEAIARLRAEVEAKSDYVGNRFADEARAMFDGEQPQRAIHGEARAEEARALLEDGIPVLPLPFASRSKAN